MSESVNAPQDDLTAERAAAIRLYENIFAMSPDTEAMEAGDDCQYEAIAGALRTARQEALREAAERLGVGDANGLLEAPCLWCGYNGEGYYQAGTHGQSCPWHTIGGCDERLDRLAREGVRG